MAKYPGNEDAESIAGLNYCILGLASEAGEIAGKMKKLYRDDGGVLLAARQDAMLDELGDVLWYLDRVSYHLRTSLETVAYKNLQKLNDRNDRSVISGDGDYR